MTLSKVAIHTPPGQHDTFLSCFCFLIFACWLVSACGVPGDPVPPSPPIPTAVSDLAAQQLGDGVLLTFTPPNKSTRGDRLTQTPTLEVLRGTMGPEGKPDPKSFRVVDTVPGSLLSSYAQQGKIVFLEPIAPVKTPTGTPEPSVFQVRTRVSERKASADSNDVSVQLYPVPARIEAVEEHETENDIHLSWSPPTQTSAGEPLPAIEAYHVYRGELDPTSVAAAQKGLHDAVWKLPMLQIASPTTPEYQDTGFDYGKTYVYLVRTAINVDGAELESSDSRPVILTPKDIFPPAAPQDVVAALLLGASPGTTVVDLSWAINLETDLAGYRVYRSEQENAREQLLTPDLLPSPAYRDNAVLSGRRYWYTVTAVDKAGNESKPSASLLVDVP